MRTVPEPTWNACIAGVVRKRYEVHISNPYNVYGTISQLTVVSLLMADVLCHTPMLYPSCRNSELAYKRRGSTRQRPSQVDTAKQVILPLLLRILSPPTTPSPSVSCPLRVIPLSWPACAH